MAVKQRVVEWKPLGPVKVKKLIGQLDPTEDMSILVREFLSEERRRHNKTIDDTFELPEGSFTKYEFVKTTPAYVLAGAPNGHLFGMDVNSTIIYAKTKSMVLFQTKYDIRIKKGCNPFSGQVLATGGKNFELEEIYYSKISSIQATHEEKTYQIIQGCMGAPAPVTDTFDGFKVRAGENFLVLSDEENELKACRKALNSKIAEFA